VPKQHYERVIKAAMACSKAMVRPLFPVMTRLIGLWRLFGSSSPTVFELTPFPIAIRFDFSVSDQYGVGPATLGAQFHFEQLRTCVGAVP
jgi:hypothetical protein